MKTQPKKIENEGSIGREKQLQAGETKDNTRPILKLVHNSIKNLEITV